MDDILLEDEQKDLLSLFVEVTRRVARKDREPIQLRDADGYNKLVVFHPGVSNEHRPEIYPGDLDALSENGLVRFRPYTYHGGDVEVTPLGFKYYERLKQATVEPAAKIELEIRRYMDAAEFERDHPRAYAKWRQAETLLWASDTEAQFTMVGHLCRESIQEFAADALDRAQLDKGGTKHAQTVARLKAVMERIPAGKDEKAFLGAILDVWGTVSDLIQRQEHGAGKEGESLVWEDARRVVFSTVVVMYEWHRTLSRGFPSVAPAT